MYAPRITVSLSIFLAGFLVVKHQVYLYFFIFETAVHEKILFFFFFFFFFLLLGKIKRRLGKQCLLSFGKGNFFIRQWKGRERKIEQAHFPHLTGCWSCLLSFGMLIIKGSDFRVFFNSILFLLTHPTLLLLLFFDLSLLILLTFSNVLLSFSTVCAPRDFLKACSWRPTVTQ